MRAFGGWVLLLALALGCARRPATGGEHPAEGVPIKVGAIQTLSGAYAVFGLSTVEGAQLAIDEINATGGVLGRPLVLQTEDDQGKLEIAAEVAGRLVQDRSLVALLGEVASTLSLTIASLAQGAGLPMVVPASTNPKVTTVGDRIFRVCFIDPYQGEAMAHYAWEKLGVRRAAVLTDSKSDYSKSLSAVFQRTFAALGGQVVSVQTYASADVAYQEQLVALLPLAPDAIYVPGYYTDVGEIAVEARALGMQARLLGGDGWDSSELVKVGGEAIVGGVFTNHFAFDDPNPAVIAFEAHFEARFGHPPDGLAALGYDAMALIAAAIRTAGTTDRDAIRDALAATHDFPGVTGTFTFNAQRDPVKPAFILRVTPDGYAYEATVGPW